MVVSPIDKRSAIALGGKPAASKAADDTIAKPNRVSFSDAAHDRALVSHRRELSTQIESSGFHAAENLWEIGPLIHEQDSHQLGAAA